jgi:hypothetical protein
VGFNQPAEIALTYYPFFSKKKKPCHVNILCRSQTATSIPGIFTKVQEIIRLFMVLDSIGVGEFPVWMRGGVDNMSTAEQVLFRRLEASMAPFIIKFESFNKIKQPEKCSCWLLKSTKGIMVLKERK